MLKLHTTNIDIQLYDVVRHIDGTNHKQLTDISGNNLNGIAEIRSLACEWPTFAGIRRVLDFIIGGTSAHNGSTGSAEIRDFWDDKKADIFI